MTLLIRNTSKINKYFGYVNDFILLNQNIILLTNILWFSQKISNVSTFIIYIDVHCHYTQIKKKSNTHNHEPT